MLTRVVDARLQIAELHGFFQEQRRVVGDTPPSPEELFLMFARDGDKLPSHALLLYAILIAVSRPFTTWDSQQPLPGRTAETDGPL